MPKSQKSFAQGPKMITKKNLQNFFPQNIPMDTWKAVLTTPTKSFRQFVGIFELDIRERLNII